MGACRAWARACPPHFFPPSPACPRAMTRRRAAPLACPRSSNAAVSVLLGQKWREMHSSEKSGYVSAAKRIRSFVFALLSFRALLALATFRITSSGNVPSA